MSVGISLPIFPNVLRAWADAIASRLRWSAPRLAPPDAGAAERITVPTAQPVLGIVTLVPTASPMEREPETAPDVGLQTLDIENDDLRAQLADTQNRLTATLEALQVVSSKLAGAQAEAAQQAHAVEGLTRQLSRRNGGTARLGLTASGAGVAAGVTIALVSVARCLSWRD